MKTKRISRRQALQQGFGWITAGALAPGLLSNNGGWAQAHVDASTSGTQGAASDGDHWAISSPNPEAVAAAGPILKRGGNAIDAAVAALASLCVVETGNVGFGGYGGSMAIYLAKEKRVTSIDFDSRAPLAFKPELFADTKRANHGYLAVGVPGIVAGLDLALRKYGTLPWKDVTAHALELAEGGFTITPEVASCFERFAGDADKTSVKALFSDGKPPTAGQRWVPKDLGKVIRAIGEGGAEAFYRGDIARATVKQVRENGGVLSDEDFKTFKALEVEPIHINYRGYDLYTPPVPSGGLTSFSILKTLENFDLPALTPWGAPYLHLFAEATKLCWEERFQQFGDPEQVKFSAEELLSPERAKERAERVRSGKVPGVKPAQPEGVHTVNVVVVDKDRNVVSITATHGSDLGAHVAIDGYALVLGHGMSRFAFDPKSPNFPAPGKRMQHNMLPTIILRDGKLWAGVGMPGGRMIVTVTPQLIVNLIDFKKSPGEALAAPRIHTEGEEPLRVSPELTPAAAAELEVLGHRLKHVDSIGGPANIAVLDDPSGRIVAASGKSGDSVLIN